jgi:hypothetical protein
MQQCQKHCPDMPIAVALPADCVTDIYLTINGQLLRYQLPVPPQPLPTSQSAKSTARCRSSALCNSGAYLWVTARDRRARQGLVIMRQVRTSLALPAVAVPLLTRLSPLLTRVGAAGCLATTGIIHAQLYRHGYQAIPLAQGSCYWPAAAARWHCYCFTPPMRCPSWPARHWPWEVWPASSHPAPSGVRICRVRLSTRSAGPAQRRGRNCGAEPTCRGTASPHQPRALGFAGREYAGEKIMNIRHPKEESLRWRA